jgi:hypothetical protein
MVKKSKYKNKRLLFVTSLLLLLAIAFFVHRHISPKISKVPAATITQLPNHTSPSDRAAGNQPASPAGSGQGIGEDTHGSADTSTPSNQWTVSSSRQITLKQPVQNDTLSSGQTISGTASVSQVYYRLIDDKSGVISQGILDSSSGNFSGKINFYSHGDSGRLDVYSLDGSGREVNEVQIQVRF